MKGYPASMRDKRITIQKRAKAQVGKFGKNSAGIVFENICTVSAAVDYVKGMRALSEGAIDAYVKVLVRMNYTDKIDERCRIVYDGDTYQIQPETFQHDKREMKIQFFAQKIIDK